MLSDRNPTTNPQTKLKLSLMVTKRSKSRLCALIVTAENSNIISSLTFPVFNSKQNLCNRPFYRTPNSKIHPTGAALVFFSAAQPHSLKITTVNEKSKEATAGKSKTTLFWCTKTDARKYSADFCMKTFSCSDY